MAFLHHGPHPLGRIIIMHHVSSCHAFIIIIIMWSSPLSQALSLMFNIDVNIIIIHYVVISIIGCLCHPHFFMGQFSPPLLQDEASVSLFFSAAPSFCCPPEP
jgi:hypothetical protein